MASRSASTAAPPPDPSPSPLSRLSPFPSFIFLLFFPSNSSIIIWYPASVDNCARPSRRAFSFPNSNSWIEKSMPSKASGTSRCTFTSQLNSLRQSGRNTSSLLSRSASSLPLPSPNPWLASLSSLPRDEFNSAFRDSNWLRFVRGSTGDLSEFSRAPLAPSAAQKLAAPKSISRARKTQSPKQRVTSDRGKSGVLRTQRNPPRNPL